MISREISCSYTHVFNKLFNGSYFYLHFLAIKIWYENMIEKNTSLALTFIGNTCELFSFDNHNKNKYFLICFPRNFHTRNQYYNIAMQISFSLHAMNCAYHVIQCYQRHSVAEYKSEEWKFIGLLYVSRKMHSNPTCFDNRNSADYVHVYCTLFSNMCRDDINSIKQT